jgi:LPXTG-site transpeptidase (sortase) family protein
MGLKISKKQNLVFKIIFFSILGILVLILLKILIWENWYYQTKTSSIRNPEQAVITDIADASAPDETKPTAQEYNEYQVAANFPRYIEIPRLEVKARAERSNVNENSMPLPTNIHDVCWYSGSARPGEGGTVLISGIKRGNSQNGAFANLDSLEKGDKIELESGDGNIYDYEVESINITSNKDAEKVLPTSQQRREGKETLSLISIGDGNDSFVLVRAIKQ